MQYTCKTCGWSGEVIGRSRCLACYRRRVKAWRKANPEQARAQKSRYDKKFRTERPDEYRAKRRRYYLPKTAARSWARRKQWIASGDVTANQLRIIFKAHDGKCVYCRVPVSHPRFNPLDPRGFDHVKPRSKGGRHTASNLVVSCRRCNELKG